MAALSLKGRVKATLGRTYAAPQDDIRVFDGYADNIHAWVVSPTFANKPDYIRQDEVWEALRAELSHADLVLISLILCFTPEEPEYQWALQDREAAAR